MPAEFAQATEHPYSSSTHRWWSLAWIALLVWAATRIEWNAVATALHHVSCGAVVGLLVACWLATIFQALRFYYLYPGGLGPMRHIALNFAVQAGNVLLPARTGEVLRPFYMKRWNPVVPVKELVVWSVIDKMVEVIAILPLVLAADAALETDPKFALISRWAWPLTALVVAVGISLIAIYWRRGWRASVQAGRSLTARNALLSIACSLMGWIFNLWIFYLVVPSVSLSLALLVGVNLASAILGLPAGFGAFEASFIWVGHMGGMSTEQALALALISHVLQIIGTLAVGVPMLARWGWPRAQQELVALKGAA